VEEPTARCHSTSLALLVPFPLTERVLEDRIDADGARWKVKSEGSAESGGIDPEATLVQLGANQMWTYEARRSETRSRQRLTIGHPESLSGTDSRRRWREWKMIV